MTVYALVDCNNFYVSCERSFNPKLRQQPVIVLSSNDGCVVARSNEAKALGIKMGVPYFQIKGLVEAERVHVFSSNFILYGDMSARVMSILGEFSNEMEVYSVDEAFLNLEGFSGLKSYAEEIRARVLQWTGIPVSIGVGSTKTMAKLANGIAKQHMRSGIFSLLDENVRLRAYRKLPVNEVWGIGKKTAQCLNTLQIFTIEDFVKMDPSHLRQQLNIAAVKTQSELQGISCIAEGERDQEAQSLTSSRSFSRAVQSLDELKASVTLHISKIAATLRKNKRAIRSLYVYAEASRFAGSPFHFGCTVSLPYSSSSTAPLLQIALSGLTSIYDPSVIYKKTGILIQELLPEGHLAQDLFTPEENPRQQQLSQLMDQVNAKFGRDQLFPGSMGIARDWLPNHSQRSRHFTTSLSEVMEVS